MSRARSLQAPGEFYGYSEGPPDLFRRQLGGGVEERARDNRIDFTSVQTDSFQLALSAKRTRTSNNPVELSRLVDRSLESARSKLGYCLRRDEREPALG